MARKRSSAAAKEAEAAAVSAAQPAASSPSQSALAPQPSAAESLAAYQGTIFYVDYENVASSGLSYIDFLREEDTVSILYRASTSKIDLVYVGRIMASKAQIELVPITPGGANALDFQLVTLMLLSLAGDPRPVVIVSNDKGYDNVIAMAGRQGVKRIRRCPSIREALKRASGDKPSTAVASDDAAEAPCEPVYELAADAASSDASNPEDVLLTEAVVEPATPAEPAAPEILVSPSARKKIDAILLEQLGDAPSKKHMDWIIATLEGRKNKSQLYNYFRSSLGREKGVDYYSQIKECWKALLRACK